MRSTPTRELLASLMRDMDESHRLENTLDAGPLPIHNVMKRDGSIMLSGWMISLREVLIWVDYYKVQYKTGKPYPNGQGFYPDAGYHHVQYCGPRSHWPRRGA